MEIGSGIEEQRILEMVRELLSHRRVAKRLHNVETVAWSTTQRWEWPRFKWQDYRKPSVFGLPSGLRDRLDLDEWRTYLSWPYLKLSTNQTVHVLQPGARAILPILLIIAGAGSLSFSLAQYASELFASIFGPVAALLFGYRLGPATRRMFLRADTIAARFAATIVGVIVATRTRKSNEQKIGYSPQAGSPATLSNLVQCKNCNGYNLPGTSTCRHCNTKLS